MSRNLVRTSSGVWSLAESMDSGGAYRPSPTPVPGAPRTPARALPAAPKDRSAMLLDLARADVSRGNLISAETNLRLALTFSPNDPQAAAELRAVLELREQARREAGLRVR